MRARSGKEWSEGEDVMVGVKKEDNSNNAGEGGGKTGSRR